MKCSVVIATYNRSDLVLQAIRSVVEQTLRPHEVIVVVDGSTDDTAARCRECCRGVTVIEQENRGRSVARNTGIASATGEWIAFLDDDDLWHREKLAEAASYLEKYPMCRALNNPVWFFGEEGSQPDAFGFRRDFIASTLEQCHTAVAETEHSDNDASYLQIRGNSHGLLLERNRGVMSASIVERNTLIRAGCFSPMQGYCDDWTMFVNVARLAEWHTLPRRLGFTRIHRSQSSNDAANGLFILSGIINAWCGGRALIRRASPVESTAALSSYGASYRQVVQQTLWQALQRGDLKLAEATCAAGVLLLPRWRDRLYALLPKCVCWRIERYLLGMHK